MSLLDKINSHPLPLAQMLGIAFIHAEPQCVVADLVVREALCTLGGRVHGGTLMALADTVGAAATFINLPQGASGTTTIESKTNFLGAASIGARLIATATPLHRGSQTQVWQTHVETELGKLVALVTQTQLVLYGAREQSPVCSKQREPVLLPLV
jgi:uncharacterized protein (TIGR00369 family)